MRHWKILIPGSLMLLLVASVATAQDQETPDNPTGTYRFLDEDGDGFNDLAPDADGDGIPNGLDPDYVRPEDGSGQQYQHIWGGSLFSNMFGLAQMYQNQGQVRGVDAGPGMNSGFGPGEPGSNGSAGGEGQAQEAGHRNGRR